VPVAVAVVRPVANPDVAASLFVGGFGGQHPVGFNASFACGSTRFFTESVDPAIWC
jgi:hypothetical protein